MERFPLKISSAEGVGRFLVASKDIEPGELLLEDHCATFGPKEVSTSSLGADVPRPCIVCVRLLGGAGEAARCAGCQMPLCSELISNKCADAHQALEECGIFKRAFIPKGKGAKVSDSDAVRLSSVAPVRMLLAQRKRPEMGEMVASLMDHAEARRDLKEHQEMCRLVVGSLRKELSKDVQDLLNRYMGILYVNSVEISRTSTGRALFPRLSLASHSCANNARHVISPSNGKSGFVLRLYSQVSISEGEEVTIAYSSLLSSTPERRSRLLRHWFFRCRCRRCTTSSSCSGPTLMPDELGTLVGSPICPGCKVGHLLPELAEGDEEDDDCVEDVAECVWGCAKCGKRVCGAPVRDLVAVLRQRLEGCGSDEEALEEFLSVTGTLLHQNHYLRCLAKRMLTQMRQVHPKRREELSQDLLDIFDVLDPGLSQSRGLTLLELLRARLDMGSSEEGGLLKEARRCLRVEAEGSLGRKRLEKMEQRVVAAARQKKDN